MTKDQAKGICHFKKTKKNLTVGDVFEMQCEWPLHLAVLSPPVRLEFFASQGQTTNTLDNKENRAPENLNLAQQIELSPYSLVILQTKNILPGKAIFKVTSYKPGHYNTKVALISDSGQVLSQPLTWKVESVLPKGTKQVKPYPPYGPWMEKWPFWYWPAGAFILTLFLVFMAFKIRLFMKRKKRIKEVQKKYRNQAPYQTFISQLNRLSWKAHQTNLKKEKLLNQDLSNKKVLANQDKKTNQTEHIIEEIEKAFRVFLESVFFIYTFEKPPMGIVQQLKKILSFGLSTAQRKHFEYFF